MTNNALTIHHMPAMDISDAGFRRQALVEFTKSIMVSGKDYGVIPGTGDKPTLLKPGAEKLTTFFGLAPRFELLDKSMDWTGSEHGGEAFFYLQYRCDLYRDNVIVGSGVGSCNSWEKKYRWRNVYPNQATDEEKATGKLETKKGRGGSTYQVYVIKNPDPADLVNTIDKMAQKRALVAATLIAVNASEFFTQDVEDMDFSGVIEGEYQEEPTPKAKPPKPATNGKASDLTPPVPTEEMKKQFHALGSKLYGDEWDDKRPELVKAASKKRQGGPVTSSNDLYRAEMQHLIDGMNERLQTTEETIEVDYPDGMETES